MSEQKNENVMLGAETFGVEPVFSASKWKVNGCIDWDIGYCNRCRAESIWRIANEQSGYTKNILPH